MSIRCVIVALLLAQAIILAISGARASDFGPGLEAEILFRSAYKNLKRHKSIAIGPGGISVSAQGFATAEGAQKDALRSCNRFLKQFPWAREYKCRSFSIDDRRVWTNPVPGPKFGTALPEPDVPLVRAKVFQPTGKLEAVVLALHGCGKPWKGPGDFGMSWFNFFTQRGAVVFFPNSFEDPMPPETCGWAGPDSWEDRVETDLIRLAQTRRSIAHLKKAYPNLPLYIWSHSGGGNIAQALDLEVSGVIVVGTMCGVGGPDYNLIPPSVPVLYVFGQNDEKLERGKTKITEKFVRSRCGPKYQTKKRRIVIASDSDHYTSIWRQNVIDAVSALMGQKSFQLKAANANAELTAAADAAFQKDYRLRPLKKAFSTGTDGTYGFSSSWSNQEDANQEALYQCAKYSGLVEKGRFYAQSGSQHCRLYAVGDKVLTER